MLTAYRIAGHKLEWLSYNGETYSVTQHPSPNHGGHIRPEMIVIHYTAGGKAAGSISWLSNRDAGVSAHVVVAHNGVITQLVPFDIKAFHAGTSVWFGKPGVNTFSIGIEIANYGPVELKDGVFHPHANPNVVLHKDDVVTARHKNPKVSYQYWQKYTIAQVDAVVNLCQALKAAYPSIQDLAGHEDVAPNRKSDPGPAFPLVQLHDTLFPVPEVAPSA